MSKEKKEKFNWKSLFRRLLLVVCGVILGVNIYLANANGLVGEKLPMPFGYGAAVVLSGSMEPKISAGDLIVVQETDSFSVNDIVVFESDNILIVHRIMEMTADTVVTKGDANNVADEPIHLSDVRGKVLFWIPSVGRIVNFLKTPIGTICVIALCIALVELPNIRQKKKDDMERKLLEEEIERLKQEDLN